LQSTNPTEVILATDAASLELDEAKAVVKGQKCKTPSKRKFFESRQEICVSDRSEFMDQYHQLEYPLPSQRFDLLSGNPRASLISSSMGGSAMPDLRSDCDRRSEKNPPDIIGFSISQVVRKFWGDGSPDSSRDR
jgi:hypothetical protein